MFRHTWVAFLPGHSRIAPENLPVRRLLANSIGLSLLVSLSWCLLRAGEPATSAGQHLDDLRGKVRAAHTAGDGAAYLAGSLEIRQFLNGSPSSILQVMSAQAFNHDEAAALASFEQFIAMGQSDRKALESAVFADLRSSARFKTLAARMDENERPIAVGSTVFEMSEAGLVPEDIDYDPVTRRFYMSSVLKNEVLAVDLSGHLRIFARAPDSRPMMALKVDSRRRRLWVTEVALNGFASIPKENWRTSVILIYDLDSGRLLQRAPGPTQTTLGDMALTPAGDGIVSDNDGGVYRVYGKDLRFERLDRGEFISPQTPAISADGRVAYVPDYLRGIAMLDLTTRNVSWMDAQGKYALNGIDGLYLSGRTMLATQNGTSPERVVRFELDKSLTRIESETVLERATPTLGDPTHGVVLNSAFYYIANSGWDTLEDDGTLKSGAVPVKSRLMRADLVGAASAAR